MIREAILEALKKRGIKQVELADHLGISKIPLNAFLKGKGKISIENLSLIHILHREYVERCINGEGPLIHLIRRGGDGL